MAVYTSINYQQPVNSDLVNEHTSEVIAPGVYRGMYIRSHGENSRCLDVRNVAEGDGDLGELSLENIGLAFMPQGMKVFLSAPQFYNEEDPILSKLIVEPAGERDRIDLVCLQYEYRKVVPSANKPSYVIIKGREALPGKLPKAPDVYSAEELDPEHGRTRDKFRRIRIPMAHIHVRVGTEFITDADISNIRRSMNTNDVLKYMDSIFYSIYGNCRFDGWLLKRDGEEYNIIVTPGTGMIDGRLHSTKMDAIVQDIKPQIVLMEEQNPSTNMSLNVQLPYPSALKFEITSNSEETIPEGASFLVSGIWIDGEQQLEETREFRLQEEIRPGETSKIIIDKAVSVSEAGINMEGIVEGGINPEDINVTVYNMPVAYIIAIAQPSNVPIFRDEYDPRYVMYLPSTEMMLGWVEVDEGEFTIYINTEINNERLHWALATTKDLDPMFRRSRYGYDYGEQDEPDPNIPDHPDIGEHHVLNVWVNDDNMVRSVDGLGEGVYTVGTNVTVTLTPEDGYHFVEWEDGNTDNPRTFIIGHEDIYITAIFAEDEHNYFTLSVTANPSDSIYTVTGSGEFEPDTSVTVTASSSDSTRGFVNWTDDSDNSVVSEDAEYIFNMPGRNVSLKANFGYNITVPVINAVYPEGSPSLRGSAYSTPDTALEDSEVTLTATLPSDIPSYVLYWEDNVDYDQSTNWKIPPATGVTESRTWTVTGSTAPGVKIVPYEVHEGRDGARYGIRRGAFEYDTAYFQPCCLGENNEQTICYTNWDDINGRYANTGRDRADLTNAVFLDECPIIDISKCVEDETIRTDSLSRQYKTYLYKYSDDIKIVTYIQYLDGDDTLYPVYFNGNFYDENHNYVTNTAYRPFDYNGNIQVATYTFTDELTAYQIKTDSMARPYVLLNSSQVLCFGKLSGPEIHDLYTDNYGRQYWTDRSDDHDFGQTSDYDILPHRHYLDPVEIYGLAICFTENSSGNTVRRDFRPMSNGYYKDSWSSTPRVRFRVRGQSCFVVNGPKLIYVSSLEGDTILP